MVHVVAFPFFPHWNETRRVRQTTREYLNVTNRGVPTICLGLVEEEGAGSGVIRRVRLLGQFC